MAVAYVAARAGLDQRAQGGDVARAAVAEHDGFDERRPVQVVDVVERRAGGDQAAHDAAVAEVGGGDQRGAVVAAGDLVRARAELEQQGERGSSSATAAMVTAS